MPAPRSSISPLVGSGMDWIAKDVWPLLVLSGHARGQRQMRSDGRLPVDLACFIPGSFKRGRDRTLHAPILEIAVEVRDALEPPVAVRIDLVRRLHKIQAGEPQLRGFSLWRSFSSLGHFLDGTPGEDHPPRPCPRIELDVPLRAWPSPDASRRTSASASKARNSPHTRFVRRILKRYRTSASSRSPRADSLPNDTSPRTRRGFLTDETNARQSLSMKRECVPDASPSGCTTTAITSLSRATHSTGQQWDGRPGFCGL